MSNGGPSERGDAGRCRQTSPTTEAFQMTWEKAVHILDVGRNLTNENFKDAYRDSEEAVRFEEETERLRREASWHDAEAKRRIREVDRRHAEMERMKDEASTAAKKRK